MDNSHIAIAVATAFAIYMLYERDNNNAKPLHQETAQKVKRDLTLLIDNYYQRYIYPHEPPHYQFVIPASRSETHNKEKIYVMIHDPVSGELFDYNSLLQAGAHECAHMLCRVEESDEHGPVFVDILSRLEDLGVTLQLFDPALKMAERYKQLCS